MTESELIKIRDAGIAASNALREIEQARDTEEHRKLIGKCFKYRSSYSCPESEADYWWDWSMVTGLDEHGGMVAFRFSRDCDGEIRIHPVEHFMVLSGHQKCGKDEFAQAWHRVLHSLPETPAVRR